MTLRLSSLRRTLALAAIALASSVLPSLALAQHQHGPAVAPSAQTSSFQIGDILITAPWSRATPAGAPVSAGYLTIHNKGAGQDRLVSASFDGAGAAEIHETTEENGIARMRRVEPGLVIAPGATVELRPGGYHLMLMRLERVLAPGEHRKATLVFEKAGPVTIDFEVRALGAGAAPAHKGH